MGRKNTRKEGSFETRKSQKALRGAAPGKVRFSKFDQSVPHNQIGNLRRP